MGTRFVTWHIPQPGCLLPACYVDRESVPTKVRMYAEQVPNGADCEVDIRDDGVTIFSNRASSKETLSVTYSEIQYNTLTGTFQVGEFITGGTSSARATVVSDKLGNLTLELWGLTEFSNNETITGATSAATAKVLSFYRGRSSTAVSVPTSKTTAVLPKGQDLEEHAEDFPESPTAIEVGSILTCHEIELGGAKNVTIQLELESVDELE